MDTTTLPGTAASPIGGNLLEGGHTRSLMQLTVLIIVVGGTVRGIMAQSRIPILTAHTEGVGSDCERGRAGDG
ncbi:MAG: hypothetical protein HYX64_03235 [Gammaproteobacteria bacterium]|nr:hypothetical protein [Gammaproteobacteria bacterium]